MTTSVLPARRVDVPAIPKASKSSRSKKPKRFECSFCPSSFKSKVSFYRHFCPKRQRRFLKCLDCAERIVGEKKYLLHLFKHVVQAKTFRFRRRKDFEEWRRSEQKKHFSTFSCLKNKEFSFFSCRFDKNCPSRILTVFKKKIILVKYTDHTHPFTLKNVNYDQFSKMTVNFIKEIISEGMPVGHINQILSGKFENYAFLDSIATKNYLSSTFMNFTQNNHRDGLMFDQVIKISENVWELKSQGMIYTVEQISKQCTSENCFYRCTYTSCSNLCSHLYQCTCRNNLCMHIHKIRSSSFESTQVILNQEDLEFFGYFVNQAYQPRNEAYLPHNETFDQFTNPMFTPKLISARENCAFSYAVNCDFNEENNFKILQDPKDYEDENRNFGKHLLTKIVLAYMEADPKVLPDVNNLLKQILETCATKIHLPIKQFTPDVENCDQKQLTRALFKIGSSTINMLSLKSLDYGISEQEIKVLRKADSCFTKGWIYDSIIDGFIERILDKEFSFLSSAVAQLVFSSNCADEGVVFEKDKCILIPYNYDGCHWILLNVDMKSKEISLYDPSSTMPQEKNVIKNLLHHIRSNLSGEEKEGFNEDDWAVTTPVHSRQRDDFNCGVFICWYCERLMKKLNLVDNVNPFEYREKIYSVIVGDYPMNDWLATTT